MSQTVYDGATALPALPGMIADTQNHDVLSRVNKEVSANIPFGVGVVQGVAENECLLPDAGADFLLGIAAFSHAYDNRDAAGLVVGVEPKDMVNVLRQGEIYVESETTTTVGGAVYCRVAGGQLGAFRQTDDGANTFLVANATFMTERTGAGLAKIELRGRVGAMS